MVVILTGAWAFYHDIRVRFADWRAGRLAGHIKRAADNDSRTRLEARRRVYLAKAESHRGPRKTLPFTLFAVSLLALLLRVFYLVPVEGAC